MDNELQVLPTDKKSSALIKTGATREKAYSTMVEALGAESVQLDKFGDEHTSPDYQARLKAAELISKLHGDMKETSIGSLTVNNVISISPEELRVFTDMVRSVRDELATLTTSGRQTGEVIDADFVAG